MECCPVVEAFFGELDEVVNMSRSRLWEEPQNNVTKVRLDRSQLF